MRHQVNVVEVGVVAPHPNAERLGVVKIDGFSVVVALADWKEGDRGVFVEPDYVAPQAPWSEVLGSKKRVRVKKIRGVDSFGLLVRLRDAGLSADTPAGTDVMSALGITRYAPPDASVLGQDAPAPDVARGTAAYDLESWRKHCGLFDADDMVHVTEKLHGEGGRFVYSGGELHLGSRIRWKKRGSGTPWDKVLDDEPWIEDWCAAHPDHILFGEVVGHVPAMNYGVRHGHRGFYAFDVWVAGGWLPVGAFVVDVPEEHRVPTLHLGAHGAVTAAMAEGRSMLADHVREGFVVKPLTERVSPEVGRVALKCVGAGFYEKGV